MNTEQYREEIKNTIAPHYNTNVSYVELYDTLCDAINLGGTIDTLKRALFYANKGPTEPAQIAMPILMQEQIYVLHGIIGLIGEACELAEVALDLIESGGHIDTINAVEEVGDVLWYTDLITNGLGVSLEAALDANVAKLKARYPDKFSYDGRLNNDKQAERDAISNALSNS